MPGILRSAIVATLLLTFPGAGHGLDCHDGRFAVQAESEELARATCTSASRVTAGLAACNVPLDRPIRIELKADFPENCMGLYHCGKDRVEILEPDTMQRRRAPESALAFVPIDSFYVSVLAHELSHAAFDASPCPFESCLTASEYVAYTMQIMSLPERYRFRFEAGLDMTTRVSRDSLNPVILFMAPDTFMRRAWVHLNQRPDACAYIGDVMQGRVRMDHPRP